MDATGLAFEESDFDGVMRETGYRRTMVQFRQTYVFAHAALAGACDKAVALDLFSRTIARAWHPDGGWVHRLDSAGNVLDATRDAYDQAFALLACAWSYRLEPDAKTLAWAHRTLEFMDRQMSSPAGGYEEAEPKRAPRRQNPHMHLYEALLALYEVSGQQTFLERASALRSLLETRFIGPTGALREYFGDAWQALPGERGECVEPGHHFEWIWLLHEHARLEPGRGLAPAERLFSFVEQHGLTARGLPIEQLDTTGAVTRDSTKLWAVCEALKAYVVRAEHEGRTFEPQVSSLLNVMFEHFLCHRSAPVWYEGVELSGSPDTRRMPTSTLYHLTLALTELMRFAGVLPRVSPMEPSLVRPTARVDVNS